MKQLVLCILSLDLGMTSRRTIYVVGFHVWKFYLEQYPIITQPSFLWLLKNDCTTKTKISKLCIASREQKVKKNFLIRQAEKPVLQLHSHIFFTLLRDLQRYLLRPLQSARVVFFIFANKKKMKFLKFFNWNENQMTLDEWEDV